MSIFHFHNIFLFVESKVKEFLEVWFTCAALSSVRAKFILGSILFLESHSFTPFIFTPLPFNSPMLPTHSLSPQHLCKKIFLVTWSPQPRRDFLLALPISKNTCCPHASLSTNSLQPTSVSKYTCSHSEFSWWAHNPVIEPLNHVMRPLHASPVTVEGLLFKTLKAPSLMLFNLHKASSPAHNFHNYHSPTHNLAIAQVGGLCSSDLITRPHYDSLCHPHQTKVKHL